MTEALFFLAVLVLEAVLRSIPTKSDNSIVAFVLRVLDKLIPNRAPGERRWVHKTECEINEGDK